MQLSETSFLLVRTGGRKGCQDSGSEPGHQELKGDFSPTTFFGLSKSMRASLRFASRKNKVAKERDNIKGKLISRK